MALDVGQLIWMAAKPIIKLALVAGGGMALSRANILTASASKLISKIIVNLLMPCLLFANMAKSLSIDNLPQLGIMTITAVFYILLGLVAGLLMKRFLNPPSRFQYGIVAASIWGNWGDLPLAIILSVGDMPPFQSGDTKLGLAFVSTLICVFNVTLFPMDDKVPPNRSSIAQSNTGEHNANEEEMKQKTDNDQITVINMDTTMTETNAPSTPHRTTTTNYDQIAFYHQFDVTYEYWHLPWYTSGFHPPVKNLFVPTSSESLPTSEPPLYFLLDTLAFIGASSVPLSITNLGAALAKMKFKTMHVRSAMHGLHWVDPLEDRALRFVYMLAGCMPTATTCLLLTQLYSPDGQAHEVAGALVLQYLGGLVTMVGALALIILIISYQLQNS
ncbi:membrane transport protein-domain-containing protein [Syncephalis plumigaleata]|nr:membrane transport protein-domain-containing protein [Syncephalis plumigaleata]